VSPLPPIIYSEHKPLILSFHLCIGLPSGHFPSGLFTKPQYKFLFSPMHVSTTFHLDAI